LDSVILSKLLWASSFGFAGRFVSGCGHTM
jgi:hypothetical protein